MRRDECRLSIESGCLTISNLELVNVSNDPCFVLTMSSTQPLPFRAMEFLQDELCDVRQKQTTHSRYSIGHGFCINKIGARRINYNTRVLMNHVV